MSSDQPEELKKRLRNNLQSAEAELATLEGLTEAVNGREIIALRQSAARAWDECVKNYYIAT